MIRILTAVSFLFHLVGSQSIYDGEDMKVAPKSFECFRIILLSKSDKMIEAFDMFQEGEVEDIWYGDHSDFPGYDDAKVPDIPQNYQPFLI